MASADHRDGFTLLETLIAFLILSSALAISAQTVAIAAKSLSISHERREAVRLAEVLRAEILPRLPDNQADAEGKDGRLHWKVKTVPISTAQAADKHAGFRVITILALSGREHRFLFFSPDLQ